MKTGWQILANGVKVTTHKFKIKLKTEWWGALMGGNFYGMKHHKGDRDLSLQMNGVTLVIQPMSINNMLRGIMKIEEFPAEGSYLGADYRYRRKRKTLKVEMEINHG